MPASRRSWGVASSSKYSSKSSASPESLSCQRALAVPASRDTKPPACRQPSVTARNSRYDGGIRRPRRASMAVIRSSEAGGNPSHRACRAASSSSSSLSPSRESAHSPLHLSRKGRQSKCVVSVMPRMLPPTTDNAPVAAAPAGSPAATASAASLDTLS